MESRKVKSSFYINIWKTRDELEIKAIKTEDILKEIKSMLGIESIVKIKEDIYLCWKPLSEMFVEVQEPTEEDKENRVLNVDIKLYDNPKPINITFDIKEED